MNEQAYTFVVLVVIAAFLMGLALGWAIHAALANLLYQLGLFRVAGADEEPFPMTLNLCLWRCW